MRHGVPSRIVNRVDELLEARALVIRQRPRAGVAATGVDAHLLRCHFACLCCGCTAVCDCCCLVSVAKAMVAGGAVRFHNACLGGLGFAEVVTARVGWIECYLSTRRQRGRSLSGRAVESASLAVVYCDYCLHFGGGMS